MPGILSGKREKSHKLRKITLLLILILSATLCFAFYYGVSPIAGSDNYIYSSDAYSLLTKGFDSLRGGGVLSIKYIVIFGETLFMKILGLNGFSVALFAILCALGTAVALYIIGRELYSTRAGLMAAALYGFLPAVVVGASNAGDDVPMAFFATLAIMFLVLGFKSKRYSKHFYLLSGFIVVIGSRTVGEELIVLLFLVIVMLWRLMRHLGKAEVLNAVAFSAGVIVGVLAIMLIGCLQSGNLFYVYNTSSAWYSTTYCGTLCH